MDDWEETEKRGLQRRFDGIMNSVIGAYVTFSSLNILAATEQPNSFEVNLLAKPVQVVHEAFGSFGPQSPDEWKVCVGLYTASTLFYACQARAENIVLHINSAKRNNRPYRGEGSFGWRR